ETNAQLERFTKKYEIGILANVDDKLLGSTRRHFRVDFDLVVTAQQVRSYKPDPAHFRECARRIGGKSGWVHIASGYAADIEPCLKMKVPVIWVNRKGEKLELLPTLLAQAGFEPDGLLATHADFDHLLGRLAFPGLALGVGEASAERLRAEPGAAQRELRDADDEHYVRRPSPLSIGAVQ